MHSFLDLYTRNPQPQNQHKHRGCVVSGSWLLSPSLSLSLSICLFLSLSLNLSFLLSLSLSILLSRFLSFALYLSLSHALSLSRSLSAYAHGMSYCLSYRIKLKIITIAKNSKQSSSIHIAIIKFSRWVLWGLCQVYLRLYILFVAFKSPAAMHQTWKGSVFILERVR